MNPTMPISLINLNYKVDAHIRKPFSMEELQLASRNLIITQRSMREKYLAEVNAFDQTMDLDTAELQFLKEFNEIIELNIDERDVAEVAIKTLGTHTVNLNKRIKVLTGLNTQAYVLKYKLNKARHLLRKGGMTISEVAYAIGFSEQDNFFLTFPKRIWLSTRLKLRVRPKFHYLVLLIWFESQL